MEVIAKCPGCQTQWEMDKNAVDRRVTCSQCGCLFRIPMLQEIPKATQVLRGARSCLFVDKEGHTYG